MRVANLCLQEEQLKKNIELNSFLNRIRSQLGNEQNSETHKSVMNLEYLKTCVCRYMQTSEKSEQLRLVPVIGTILQFTDAETKSILDSKRFRTVRLENSNKSGESDTLSAIYTSLFGK